MRITIVVSLIFFICSIFLQTPATPPQSIDYTRRFSAETRTQGKKDTIYNLKPMLDIGVMVPNGGIFRFTFTKQKWGDYVSKNFVQTFGEAGYRTNNTLYYYRFDWYRLEGQKDVYLFEDVIEPLLVDAYKKNARVILGLVCNCGSSSVPQKVNGKSVAVPLYLYKELQDSEYPMFEDKLYGDAYVPNYDSPLLIDRHNALLNAFAKWIEGNLKNTNVKRKDLIFGIETRYFGYWGEGSSLAKYYPKTELFHQYLDSYNKYFPDKLIIGSIHHVTHLPVETLFNKNPENRTYVLAMQHCSKLFSMENDFGPWGFFIDSWQYNSDSYDLCSQKVVFDNNGKPTKLALWLRDKIYGKRFLTGEFDFFGKKGDEPYGGLYQQFTSRGISSMSINGIRAAIDGVRLPVIPDSVYTNVRECLSMVGYRIVLDPTPVFYKKGSKRYVTITLSNIGVSRIFPDYYRLRFFVKNTENAIIYDTISDFDIRDLLPQPDSPLLYDKSKGIEISQFVGRKKGMLYLQIIDTKGIEQPLTLSNYGRQKDGSYCLGELK